MNTELSHQVSSNAQVIINIQIPVLAMFYYIPHFREFDFNHPYKSINDNFVQQNEVINFNTGMQTCESNRRPYQVTTNQIELHNKLPLNPCSSHDDPQSIKSVSETPPPNIQPYEVILNQEINDLKHTIPKQIKIDKHEINLTSNEILPIDYQDPILSKLIEDYVQHSQTNSFDNSHIEEKLNCLKKILLVIFSAEDTFYFNFDYEKKVLRSLLIILHFKQINNTKLRSVQKRRLEICQY